MKYGLTTISDNTQDLRDALAYLQDTRVMVGIPEDKAERKDGKASNAVIGYVLENGEPGHNLPARPFLVPGVASISDEIVASFAKAGQAALAGDKGAVRDIYTKMGLRAATAVKRFIDQQDFAPLAEATVKARLAKLPGKAKDDLAFDLAAGRTTMAAIASGATTFLKILIDTGALRNSITFVLRYKDQDIGGS